jgi:hypothetical protein
VEATVPPENNDEEIKYGDWYVYDAEMVLADEKKLFPPADISDIWPHWSEGVPKKLRWTGWSEPYWDGKVYYKSRPHTSTVELDWEDPYALPFLDANKHLLPGNYTNQWSGVYRIFVPDQKIPRCGGEDPTGTLYLGCAGTRDRSWSILRSRIQSVLTQRHNATITWWSSDVLRQRYPWKSLSVEWAYTGKTLNYKGEVILEAIMAESMLLSCYRHSYGELPPLNERH